MGKAYWEIISEEISRDGWSWGMVEATVKGRQMYVVDAHRGNLTPRYVVRADTLPGRIPPPETGPTRGRGMNPVKAWRDYLWRRVDRGEMEDTLAGAIFVAVPLACGWAAWEVGRLILGVVG
jgi:hypothetical protein